MRGIVPETVAPARITSGDEPVVDVLVATEVASSRGDARRTIQHGGVRLNGRKVGPGDGVEPIDGRFVLVQKGKKQRHLLVLDG